jgi:hypothetical protein
MATNVATRHDLETALIEKCWKDPEFKRKVISDPKGMLEQHTGQRLPPGVKIFIHEEDGNTLHLSIPPAPANLAELSDEDLEKVAGGTEVVALTILASIGISVLSVGTIVSAIGGDEVW